jgi:hypothetical protein
VDWQPAPRSSVRAAEHIRPWFPFFIGIEDVCQSRTAVFVARHRFFLREVPVEAYLVKETMVIFSRSGCYGLFPAHQLTILTCLVIETPPRSARVSGCRPLPEKAALKPWSASQLVALVASSRRKRDVLHDLGLTFDAHARIRDIKPE